MNPRRTVLFLLAPLLLSAAVGSVGAAQESADRKEKKKAEPKPSYDMLYQLHVPTFADLVIDKIKTDVEKELSVQRDGQSDADFEIRKRFSRTFMESVCSAIGDLEEAKLGWSLDRAKKRTSLDLAFTVRKKSGLEVQLAQMANKKTAFQGFALQNSAFAARWLGQANAKDAAGYATVVEALRDKAINDIEGESVSDDEKKARKDLTTGIFDVLQQTVASGRSDGAVSVQLSQNQITLIAGSYVSSGPQLETALRPIAQFLQQNHPVFASLRLDAEKLDGVNLHSMTIPAPDGSDREGFVRMFGDQLDIVVGFGSEALYIAAGRDAMAALKGAIEKSKTPSVVASPSEITLAVKPVADFVATMGKGNDQATAREISEVLSASPGDAIVKLSTQVDKRTITLRIEVAEGIVQWIARMNPDLKRLLLEE